MLLIPFALDEEKVQDFIALPEAADSGKQVQFENLSFLVFMCCANYDEDTQTVVLAKDLVPLIKAITPSVVQRILKEMKQFDYGFMILIQHYGLMDLKAVRDFMKRDFNVNLTQQRSNLLVYWYYSIHSIVRTGNLSSGKSIVFEPYIDMMKIAPLYDIHSNMIPYEPIADFQLENWKKYGNYLEAFTGWGYLWAFYILNGQIERQHARALVDEMYTMVRNGSNLETCMKYIGYEKNNTVIEIRFRIWEIALHCLTGTVLPEMKGGSRIQTYFDPKYCMCYTMPFVEKEVKDDNIKPDTHIEDMSMRLQIQIGAMLFTLEEADLPSLRKIRREHPDNIDLTYILGKAYQRTGHFPEAISCFKLVDALLKGKDSSVKQIIQACEQGNEMQPMNLWDDGVLMPRKL